MKEKDGSNKSFWERFAFIYGTFMKKNDRCYEELCSLCIPYIKSDASVLELACGTGQLSFRLASKAKAWKATDFSPEMIRQTEKSNDIPSLDFEEQDATNLTFGDSSFDAVLIANGLHIMPDPDSALKEIHRVLKDGGILIAPTFVYDSLRHRLKLFAMEKAGFKTFHRWKGSQYKAYLEGQGFKTLSFSILDGNPLKECFIALTKT